MIKKIFIYQALEEAEGMDGGCSSSGNGRPPTGLSWGWLATRGSPIEGMVGMCVGAHSLSGVPFKKWADQFLKMVGPDSLIWSGG